MRDHIWLFVICTAIMLGCWDSLPRTTGRGFVLQRMSATFFKMLQQGQGAEAIDYLLGTNPP